MDKVLAMLTRGIKGFGVVLTRVLEVLTILEGGGTEVLPCLEERGTQKVTNPQFYHFVAPPPPPNN